MRKPSSKIDHFIKEFGVKSRKTNGQKTYIYKKSAPFTIELILNHWPNSCGSREICTLNSIWLHFPSRASFKYKSSINPMPFFIFSSKSYLTSTLKTRLLWLMSFPFCRLNMCPCLTILEARYFCIKSFFNISKIKNSTRNAKGYKISINFSKWRIMKSLRNFLITKKWRKDVF